MLVSACLRHDLQPNVITKAGTTHKGGYRSHPCTIWGGDSRENATWLHSWGMALCKEYTERYGKVHFAEGQLNQLYTTISFIPPSSFTSPAQAMPDECKDEDPIIAYRNCIQNKLNTKPGVFVWNKGRAMPEWLTATT